MRVVPQDTQTQIPPGVFSQNITPVHSKHKALDFICSSMKRFKSRCAKSSLFISSQRVKVVIAIGYRPFSGITCSSMQMETQDLQEVWGKSTISVHGWMGNKDVTPVRRRLTVRDGLLPAVALNDLCYGGVADERWRRAVKYPIFRLLNQVCCLSKHTTAVQQEEAGAGRRGARRRAEAPVQVPDNLAAKRSDMRSHSRPRVNVIAFPHCQQTCQPEGTFP